jgi:hypothetical protein
MQANRAQPMSFPDLIYNPGWQAYRPTMLLAAQQSGGKRFWETQLELTPSTVAPGHSSEVLRIASSVLHILSHATAAPLPGASEAFLTGRKAAQGRFSEEGFRRLLARTGNVFHKLYRQFRKTFTELTAHSKPGLTRGTLQI